MNEDYEFLLNTEYLKLDIDRVYDLTMIVPVFLIFYNFLVLPFMTVWFFISNSIIWFMWSLELIGILYRADE